MSLDIITLGLAKSYTNQHSGGGGQVQPDWNQNDETQPDYVKNRPFYTGDTVETVLLEETTATFAKKGANYQTKISANFSLEVDATYKVSWDGIVYSCVGYEFNGTAVIGNQYIFTSTSDTGEPFIAAVNTDKGTLMIATQDTSASHTISISKSDGKVKKINEKYLPDNSPLILYYNFGEIEGTIDDRTGFIVYKNHDASNPELAELTEVGKAFLTKGVVIVNVRGNYFYKPDEYNPNERYLGSSNLRFQLKPMA